MVIRKNEKNKLDRQEAVIAYDNFLATSEPSKSP